MATTPTLLSIDQYLHTSYKPDVHFVDGEIEERNVGERTHSSIQKFITDLFTKNEDIWKMEAIFELRIRIGSSRAARQAGALLAASDTTSRMLATAVNFTGSRGSTP